MRIRDLAHAHPQFRSLRIWVLLRHEGWLVNRKRVRRLYRLEGLQLRMRVRRRKHIALHRGLASIPTGPTERWSMDFVHAFQAPSPSRWITGPSFNHERSKIGPIGGACNSTSFDRGSLWKMPVLNPLTVDCVMNG